MFYGQEDIKEKKNLQIQNFLFSSTVGQVLQYVLLLVLYVLYVLYYYEVQSNSGRWTIFPAFSLVLVISLHPRAQTRDIFEEEKVAV